MVRSLLAATILAIGAVGVPATAQVLKGDVAAGEKLFNQCKTCHVAEKGINRVGPSLFGVVGRKAGTVQGFKYSPANLNSGVTWDAATLSQYLEAPMKFMPGTKMAYFGMKKPQDRADIIAFLATKK